MVLVYLLLVKNGIWYGYKLALVLMISVFAQHLKRSTIVNDKWGERALACCCASTNWGWLPLFSCSFAFACTFAHFHICLHILGSTNWGWLPTSSPVWAVACLHTHSLEALEATPSAQQTGVDPPTLLLSYTFASKHILTISQIVWLAHALVYVWSLLCALAYSILSGWQDVFTASRSDLVHTTQVISSDKTDRILFADTLYAYWLQSCLVMGS